jgi:hypothetical protein
MLTRQGDGIVVGRRRIRSGFGDPGTLDAKSLHALALYFEGIFPM